MPTDNPGKGLNQGIRHIIPKSLVDFTPSLQIIGGIESQLQAVQDTYQLVNKFFQPGLLSLIKSVTQWVELEKVSHCFRSGGMWLAPSMSQALVKTILKRCEEGRPKTIPLAVDGFYRRDKWAVLKNTVGQWASYDSFIPRMAIFNDALEAHIDRKYTLSVPALLPHIEGIAREIAIKNGLPTSQQAIVVDMGGKTHPSAIFGQISADKVTPSMDIAISSLLDYLEGTLYVYKDFQDYPRITRLQTLNRHAVLHGVYWRYATRLNSLKCFLALDGLSMLEGNMPELAEQT